MSIFIIWVDRENAKLFQFSQLKMERSQVKAQYADHPAHQIDALDRTRSEKEFYNELASKMSEASQILIIGPGVARHHFQNHLLEHFPIVAKKVVGCENVDQPTDSQVALIAQRFFKLGTAKLGVV